MRAWVLILPFRLRLVVLVGSLCICPRPGLSSYCACLVSPRPLASTSGFLYVLACWTTNPKFSLTSLQRAPTPYQNLGYPALGGFPWRLLKPLSSLSYQITGTAILFHLSSLTRPVLSTDKPTPGPPAPTYLLLGTLPPSHPRSSAGGVAHMLQLAPNSLTHPDSMSTCMVCQSPALEAGEVGQEEQRVGAERNL